MPAQGRARHAPPAPARPRRRHPARSARLAAIGMSIASAAGLTAFFDRGAVSGGQAVSSARVVAGAPPTTPATAPVTTIRPTVRSTIRTTTTTTSARLHVVDGGVYQNRWGPVQVEVTFAPDGGIRSADAIQTPDSHGRSIQINDHAVPILDAEAVSAQGAQVHTV